MLSLEEPSYNSIRIGGYVRKSMFFEFLAPAINRFYAGKGMWFCRAFLSGPFVLYVCGTLELLAHYCLLHADQCPVIGSTASPPLESNECLSCCWSWGGSGGWQNRRARAAAGSAMWPPTQWPPASTAQLQALCEPHQRHRGGREASQLREKQEGERISNPCLIASPLGHPNFGEPGPTIQAGTG
jgi:hypothetical protein